MGHGLWSRPTLEEVIDGLRGRYALPPALRDPLALILWENIGYLIDDGRRAELFADFQAGVGLDARRIAAAPDEVLRPIAERGGMHPGRRLERWRAIARIVLEEAAGDLSGALSALPTARARTLLKRFPAIGDPGADKVLLFSGIAVRPAVDSNGLRVLTRLGLVEPAPSYGSAYKVAVALLAAEGRADRDWLIEAYGLLREHGRSLCRRSGPDCLPCPLDPRCAHVAAVEF